MAKTKHYAIVRGLTMGVFAIPWEKGREYVDGFTNAKYKGFSCLEDAVAWYLAEKGEECFLTEEQLATAKCKASPKDSCQPLRYQRLADILPNNEQNCMRPLDMPKSLIHSILDWFHVTALENMPEDQLQAIKEQNIIYSDGQETGYQGERADNYLLAYMPANFFKIWLPLWNLLQKQCLGTKLKVLDLGAGPGTSTFSLWCFFSLLARDNPDREFVLDCCAVERESSFVKIMQSLDATYRSSVQTDNLRINLRVDQKDIYNYAACEKGQYDLVMESNVLNCNEAISWDKQKSLPLVLMNKLKEPGTLILLEPGKEKNRNALGAIQRLLANYPIMECVVPPKIHAVPLGGLSLLKSAEKLDIRHTHQEKHWFSYAIFQKGCEQL